MNYQNWTWSDDATTEQMDNAHNVGAVKRLASEARALYDSIPDPSDEHAAESRDIARENAFESAPDEESGESAVKELEAKWSKDRAAIWGELEAITELMAKRGARFTRPYEHHNEEERMIEYLENRND